MLRKALSLILLLLSAIAYGQESKEAIKKIEDKVRRIDSAKGLTVKVLRDKEVDELADGGLSLTGYYKNDKLIKMQFWVAQMEAIWDCSYYYDNDSLIFANEKEKAYRVDSAKMEIDFNHTTVKMDNRFYFDKGKLIRKTTNGEPMKSEMTDEQVAAGIRKYCDDYFLKLQKSRDAMKLD